MVVKQGKLLNSYSIFEILVSDAKITRGYNLAAPWVIHTVGPIGENAKVLKSCYSKCMDLVEEHKLTSIAFPCISTGVYGYPSEKAAPIALEAVSSWIKTHSYASQIQEVIFCVFLVKDCNLYTSLFPQYF